MRLTTRESDVVAACLEYLKYVGIMAWRNNTTGIYDPAKKRFRAFTGMKGVSDILGVLPLGRLLAVECKSKTGKLSAEQAHFLASVNAAGGLGVCVRDVRELWSVIKSVQGCPVEEVK